MWCVMVFVSHYNRYIPILECSHLTKDKAIAERDDIIRNNPDLSVISCFEICV